MDLPLLIFRKAIHLRIQVFNEVSFGCCGLDGAWNQLFVHRPPLFTSQPRHLWLLHHAHGISGSVGGMRLRVDVGSVAGNLGLCLACLGSVFEIMKVY